MAICLGCTGMSIDDFWDAEWREIMAAVYGYLQAEQRTMRTSWEQARLVAFSAARPHYQHLQPDQIIALPWHQVKPKPLTKEEIERIKKRDAKWDREEKNKWEQKQKAKRFK